MQWINRIIMEEDKLIPYDDHILLYPTGNRRANGRREYRIVNVNAWSEKEIESFWKWVETREDAIQQEEDR